MSSINARKTSITLSSSLFRNRQFSVLEALTVYLKEKKKLTYAQIARLLNRDDRTIWTVYNRAKKKPTTKSTTSKGSIAFPLSILSNRKFSCLEALVKYLKEKKGLTYAQIARLLNRDDRTIWTVYNRAKKKGGEE